MNTKTDINWRDIEEDYSVLLPENQDRQILIETEMSLYFSMSDYVTANHYVKGKDEKVLRYAFID